VVTGGKEGRKEGHVPDARKNRVDNHDGRPPPETRSEGGREGSEEEFRTLIGSCCACPPLSLSLPPSLPPSPPPSSPRPKPLQQDIVIPVLRAKKQPSDVDGEGIAREARVQALREGGGREGG